MTTDKKPREIIEMVKRRKSLYRKWASNDELLTDPEHREHLDLNTELAPIDTQQVFIDALDAATDEIARLNGVVKMLNQEYGDACKPHEERDLDIAQLKEKLRVAKEALEFYADGTKMYEPCYDGHGDILGFMPGHDDFELGIEGWRKMNHFGKRARKALAQIDGDKGET